MILLRFFGLRLAYRGLLRVVVFCKLVKSLGWLVSLERLTYVKKGFCLETFVDSHWLDKVDASDNAKSVVRKLRPTLESYCV